MAIQMSACGIVCSECGAYVAGKTDDLTTKVQTAAAWHDIFKFDVAPEALACGGCLNLEAPAFATCQDCFVRQCVLAKGIAHCAVCDDYPCAELNRVQAQTDGLEKLAETMAEEDFARFVQPFCDARERMSAATRPLWEWS